MKTEQRNFRYVTSTIPAIVCIYRTQRHPTGRRNRNLVRWKTLPNMRECLWEFRFIIKCRDSLVLHENTLIFATPMNKSVNIVLHSIGCQGKVSLFYAGTSDWFRRKIDPLYNGRKTLYRVNVWNLLLELCIAGLENMGARQNSH